MTRLTKTKLDALQRRPPASRTDLADAQVPGLMVRVTPSGTITWSLQYRVAGAGGTSTRGHCLMGAPRHRVTIGRYPAVGISEARTQASQYKEMADRGRDPRAQLEREATASRDTVAALAGAFMERHVHANRLRSAENFEMALRVHILPAWGGRSPASVTRADARALLRRQVLPKRRVGVGSYHGGPAAAHTVRQVLHRMFEWACEEDLLPANPIAGVRDPVRARSRDRVLSMDEMRAVWAAAGTLGQPMGPLYQLLMLTACRRGEWAASRRPWLDLSAGSMEIPAESYKSGRAHVVPLVDRAVEIVEGLPRWNASDFLLSGTGGARPLSGFSRGKARLDRAVKAELGRPIEGWRVHDIRRSVAAHLARLGVDDIVVEHVLGHSISGVKGTYNRYKYVEEKRAALELWARELLG